MAFKLCCSCNKESSTLRAFDPDDGTLIWERRLLGPTLSTDGKIYGLAYQKDTSTASRHFKLFRLGSAVSLRVGMLDSTVKRRKVWIRCIDAATGLTVSDSDVFWYQTEAATLSDLLFPELLQDEEFFSQDLFGANSDGDIVVAKSMSFGLVQRTASIAVWDSGNITTTRRYTLAAAAIPETSFSATVVAEANGIHSETSATITGMQGKTAATWESDIEAAFPHVVSCTATGGPWPQNHLDFEIEFEHDTYHLKSFVLSATENGGPYTRNAMSGNITAWTSTAEKASVEGEKWQFTTADALVGLTRFRSGIGLAVEHMSQAADSPIDLWEQDWSTVPSGTRTTNVKHNGSDVVYHRPSTRNGKIIVSHYPVQGNDQGSFESSVHHEFDPSAGTLLSNRESGLRFPSRSIFASNSTMLLTGYQNGNSFTGLLSVNDTWKVQQPYQWYAALTSDLENGAMTYNGSYGPYDMADTEKLFWSRPWFSLSTVGANGLVLKTSGTDNNYIATSFAGRSDYETVSGGDSMFSLGTYYRCRLFSWSHINCRWRTDLQWRFAWYSASPTSGNTEPDFMTSWLDFDADSSDVQTALDAVWGSNITGDPNCVIPSAPDWPETAADFLPSMWWQRNLPIYILSQIANFPPPGVPFDLADRAYAQHMRIQVKTPVIGEFTVNPQTNVRSNQIGAMNWDDGAIVWSRPFGTWKTSAGSSTTQRCLRTADHLLVYGNEVKAELDPEVVVDFGTAP
jgi:hypothetical protein